MIVHYDIRITGKVQKVGFRFHAHLEAVRHNICGFVRNLPDGSLYIEAEGDEKDLEHYLQWCKQGPTAAVIDNVDARKAPVSGYTTFNIRH